MKRITPAALTLALLSIAQTHAQTTNDEAVMPIIDVNSNAQSTQAKQASVAGFDDAPLNTTPASVTVINDQVLLNQQARLLSDVIKNDPSITENYAPVGYYENIAVRGFALDYGNSYLINGMSIAGEQNVALDNKERVEIVNGIASLQNGASAPGGVVNYVTKRPANVRSLMLGFDQHGSRQYSADLGILFGERKQFGLRINAAHDDIHSYVEHADGRREFASLAASWVLSSQAALQFNIEHQEKVQRSVSGYQLLGGTVVPSNVSRTRLLGYQSWMEPVRIDSLNMDLRLDLELNNQWRSYVAASRSRSIIDDNVSFAFGDTSYGISFDANGDYAIYDYRSHDDTRQNDQLKAVMIGDINIANMRHELSFGVSTTRRTVDKSNGINEMIGSNNIYNASAPQFAQSTTPMPPGFRNIDHRQQAIFVSDKISFNDQWQLQVGGRQVWLHEKNYDATGTTLRDTKQNKFLPQIALMYRPTERTMLYTNYTENLSLGGQTPWWVDNALLFLSPTITRQLEAGVKHDLSNDISITAAIFQMRKPFEYPQPDSSAAGFTYVQQGDQTHRGIELGLNGQVTKDLRLAAGLTVLQARANDTGTESYNGHQTINAPRLRSALHADYRIPGIEGVNLMGSWLYSAKKAANRAGTAEVGAYHVFNAGLRYQTRIAGNLTTVRFNVDNVFDKTYWKDVGEYLGDSYLHLGAPRTARVTVQYEF